jgi:hypothetical protein
MPKCPSSPVAERHRRAVGLLGFIEGNAKACVRWPCGAGYLSAHLF